VRVAIVVQGRFHAFDLALALQRRGADVTVFTNYPAWAAARFGLPRASVRSLWPHGVAARLLGAVPGLLRRPWIEAAFHRWFGRWAARAVLREHWDVIHCWSGVSEELMLDPRAARVPTWLMRGSAHIRSQAAILLEEERRNGVAIDRPSAWMIAREEREYALATTVRLASSFAYRTFLEHGFPESRMKVLPLATRVQAFRPAPEVAEARARRIEEGRPLRVLYVGNVSYQKGMRDFGDMVRALDAARFEVRAVGAVSPECEPLVQALRGRVDWAGRVPQAALPAHYAWADVFVFPTLHDGFAVVLAQAQASALPILATTNCAGPDLVHEGRDGWVLPIRDGAAFAQRLAWCDAHRSELAAMTRDLYRLHRVRDWDDVAADFADMFRTEQQRNGGARTA
jgi:glycosyltransferase involved in cell wall biosynthesis